MDYTGAELFMVLDADTGRYCFYTKRLLSNCVFNSVFFTVETLLATRADCAHLSAFVTTKDANESTQVSTNLTKPCQHF